MTRLQQNNVSFKRTYYEKKKVPPPEGCAGLILAFIIFFLIGMAIGDNFSSELLLVTIPPISAGIGILWFVKQHGYNIGEYGYFAIRSTIWALVVLMAILIIAVLKH